MGKIKEIMSKNSYLVPKIAGGVAAVSVAVLTVVLIVGSGDDETADGKLTGSKVAEVSAHSSKDIGEADETEELTTSNNDTVGTDELQSDTGDSTTDESTEATETTVIAMGGNDGGGNQSSGGTSGTTTPTKPSNSSGGQSGTTAPTAATTAPTTAPPVTTQPTTAAPVVNKRGANGVILETLTVYYTSGETYTIPDTWQELSKDNENLSIGSSYALKYYYTWHERIPFRNELVFFNASDNKKGSAIEEIIKTYGEPMWTTQNESGDTLYIYKYINSDLKDDENLCVSFIFNDATQNRLGAIFVTCTSTLKEANYIQ